MVYVDTNLAVPLYPRAHSLVILDVSYNKIVSLPAEIGKLQMLRCSALPVMLGHALPRHPRYTDLIVADREFKASFNQLTALPPEVGKLKRLKKLVINGNKLVTIPKEVAHPRSPPLSLSLVTLLVSPLQVGRLEMLEELVLSENSLEELPANLTSMSMLRVLKVSRALHKISQSAIGCSALQYYMDVLWKPPLILPVSFSAAEQQAEDHPLRDRGHQHARGAQRRGKHQARDGITWAYMITACCIGIVYLTGLSYLSRSGAQGLAGQFGQRSVHMPRAQR